MINKVAKCEPLKGTNGQLMIMAAHRYCLGRQSYIVGACIEWLSAFWHLAEPQTKAVILRDTKGAIADGVAGAKHDTMEWQQFVKWAEQREGK